MKIRFHLNRFENELHFQLVDISNELDGLGFLDKANNICIVNTNQWSKSFCFHNPLIATHWRNDDNTLYLNISESKLSIRKISFINNTDRDFWYGKILNSLEKSFKIDVITNKDSWTIL